MRRQTTIIRCDGDGCKVLAEVPDINETPDGWYRIQEAKDGKLNPRVTFDVCSLRCMERWAKGRRAFLSPTGKRSSDSVPGLIMALFNSDPTAEISTVEICELLDKPSTTVRNALSELALEGDLVRSHEGGAGQGNASRYRLAVKVPA